MPAAAKSLEASARHAQAAVEKIAQHRIAPEPNAYAVWYHYSDQSVPELNEVLDDLLSRGRTIDHEVIDELYRRFLGHAAERTLVEETNTKLQGLLSRFVKMAVGTGKDASGFADLLNEFSAEIESGGALDGILQTVQQATADMEAKSRDMEAELQASVDEVARLKEDLEQAQAQAMSDGLTELSNRRHFDSALQSALASAEAEGSPLTLIMTDIDHFKKFNDTHGHQLGDQVIQLVSHCIRREIRDQDTAARYGGEEFAIILPATALEDGMAISEALRKSVASKRITKKSTGETIGDITLTAGVAQSQPGEVSDQLIARADAALYLGKQAGRNCVKAADGV